ncbi:nitrite reductase (NAD(P)H) small subunit [Chitinophaga pendula]|uniref:Rieske (2Fe-2S) protein n=1 Tax=Chitinophaga TaxID=79328 RepID=UPI000BB0BC52|nr:MULTISPECIES: Rieske 2Fe-2S domain-containing protein [Chitinophaga]ASZ10214.1 (2Fe-2S)-binding protein [Chitinophaga sp. MD30]UCJ06827.1 nitrite reductase (NAD(P)H) small subunit [Chitinophaga pendula]
MAKEYNWHRVAASDADMIIAENEITVRELNGKKICCTRYEGKLYAFAYKCPHASGIMADGYIDDTGNVVCPLHRYRFALRNGYNTSGEGYYLKTYPVELREDGVYIGQEKSSWLGW